MDMEGIKKPMECQESAIFSGVTLRNCRVLINLRFLSCPHQSSIFSGATLRTSKEGNTYRRSDSIKKDSTCSDRTVGELSCPHQSSFLHY